MGPVTDETTRGMLTRALEDPPGVHDGNGRRSNPATVSSAALQQLTTDRAVLIEGRSPSALIELTPWWRDRRLRSRGTGLVPARRRLRSGEQI